MANTPKALFRGAATTTTTTTLYTVPSNTTTTVTNILIANTSGSSGSFTLALDGVSIGTTVPVAANSITTMDIKQVLATTKTITGGASSTSITFHISGMETA
jgi:hypothetical protein